MHKTPETGSSPAAPDEQPQLGGVVTTLHQVDLPILRDVLPLPLPLLQRAVIDIPLSALSELTDLLPPTTPFAELLEHLSDLSALPPNTTAGGFEHKTPLADVVQILRDKLSLSEMDLFTYCPVSVRDPQSLAIFSSIVKAYAEEGIVEIDKIVEPTKLFVTLDMVEATLAVLPPLPPEFGVGKRLLIPPILVTSIPLLETLHKSLTLYIWLSFRLEIAFPDRNSAQSYKERVEKCLAECLDRMPGLRNKKTYERTKQGDRAIADWRKANVSPKGTMKMVGSRPKGVEWEERAVIQRLKNKELWRGAGFVSGEDGGFRKLSIGDGRSEGEVVREDVDKEGLEEVQSGVMDEETERIQRAVG
jgi:ATP-dependent RNA helicase SUPV3L1/SUV3